MDFAGSLNYYDGSSYTAASSGASQSWYRAGQAAMPGTERHQNLQWTLPKTPTSFSGSSRRGTGPQPPSRHGSIAESETGASDRDHSDDGGNGQGGSGAANKRKRPSRYKGVSEEILNKRRAQNRSSQRAYRDRKNMRIKELEAQLANVHRENDMLNLQLRAERQAGSAASGLQAGGADPTTCGLDWCALNLGLESADLSELAFSPDQMLGPWPLGISLPSFL